MDKRILKYIKKNHVMMVSTLDNGNTWSTPLYYAFDENNASLVFMSDINTKHMVNAAISDKVSGAITNQQSNIVLIKGIQFTGKIVMDEPEKLYKIYYSRFPFARLIPSDVGCIRLDFIKYTSNIPVFGNKIFWERSL